MSYSKQQGTEGPSGSASGSSASGSRSPKKQAPCPAVTTGRPSSSGFGEVKQQRPPSEWASSSSSGAVGPEIYDECGGKQVFILVGSEKQKLVLWKTDILTVKASAIVSVEDSTGAGRGKVAEVIAKKISPMQIAQFRTEKIRKFSKKPPKGHVLITKGYDSGFRHIFHVVLAASEVAKIPNSKRKVLIGKTYKNIFKSAHRDNDTKSIVIPLVGTGAETVDEVQLAADSFIDSYTVFCNRKINKPNSKPLTVYLVFKDSDKFSQVLEKLNTYVTASQAHEKGPPTSPSPTRKDLWVTHGEEYKKKLDSSENNEVSAEINPGIIQHLGNKLKVWLSQIELKFKLKLTTEDGMVSIRGSLEEVWCFEKYLDKTFQCDQDDFSTNPDTVRSTLKGKLATYVEMENIPADSTTDSIRAALFVSGFPVPSPVVVYSQGMTKAILICKTAEDAIRVSKYKGSLQMKFKCLNTQQSLIRFRVSVNTQLINEAIQRDLLDNLTKDLKAIDVTLVSEKIVEIVTSCQLKCAVKIVAFYAHKLGISDRETKDSGYEILERINDLSELVWDIVRTNKKKEIDLIRSNNGIVKFENLSLSLAIDDESDDGKASMEVLKSFAEAMKISELEDIQLEDASEETAVQWCRDIEETMSSACCVYIPGKKKVIAYCETYDDILKVKHQLELKQKKIKVTGRRRAQRTVETTAYHDSGPPSLQFQDNLKDVDTRNRQIVNPDQEDSDSDNRQRKHRTRFNWQRTVEPTSLTDRNSCATQLQFKDNAKTVESLHIRKTEKVANPVEEYSDSSKIQRKTGSIALYKTSKGQVTEELVAQHDCPLSVHLKSIPAQGDMDDSSSGEMPKQLVTQHDCPDSIILVSTEAEADKDQSSSDVVTQHDCPDSIILVSTAAEADKDQSSSDGDNLSMESVDLILRFKDKHGQSNSRILRAESGQEAIKWRYIFQNQDSINSFAQKLVPLAATMEYSGGSHAFVDTDKVVKPKSFLKNIKHLIESEAASLSVLETLVDAGEVEKVFEVMSLTCSLFKTKRVLRFMQHPSGQTKLWFVGLHDDVTEVMEMFKHTQGYLSKVTVGNVTQRNPQK